MKGMPPDLEVTRAELDAMNPSLATQSAEARVDDERRPDQELPEFLHGLLAGLRGLFALVLTLALRRGDLAKGAPSFRLTAPSKDNRDDLLRIQERLLARGFADGRA